MVTHEVVVAPVPAARTTKQPLVVLITSDALRADHLGCYGHPTVRTANMDALAANGALFPHARTQSPATLGAHASILTGLLPTQHGITAEWGSLPDRLVTLPQFLAARGWHTAMAPSEYELYEADRGMVRLFQQVLPCLAVPAQDGAITTRQVLRWLDHTSDDPRPSRPTFLWIEYFDTHPPATPPAPFRTMYYAGDPSDPRNTYRPEWVGKIRGIESVAEFEISLELLPAGRADPGLVDRLRATARVLRAQDSVGPDLAAHLIAMGNDACMGMERTDFADWLDVQAQRVEEKRVTPEFLVWLRDIDLRLKVAKTEIVAWLDGVVDYRYAIAQYMAEVSYLDHHIGTLVAALRAHGLYDDALIIVTSPHGELLAEGDLHFHHHALLEEVLRVPMMIKLPATSAMGRRGVRPGGVFDSIDLFPTVVDAVGLTVPAGLAGVSRWKHVCDGSDIPPHDSFAVDYLALTFALARPPLVYHKARADYQVSQQWSWTAGEARVYKMSELQTRITRRDLRQVMPEATQAMEERLTLLMATHPQF